MITREQLDAMVREHLETHPSSSAHEIAAALGSPDDKRRDIRRVYVALDRLRSSGDVIGDTSWPTRWRLTELADKPIRLSTAQAKRAVSLLLTAAGLGLDDGALEAEAIAMAQLLADQLGA